jgi:probable HAF family extracellular repeat protein
LPGGFVASPAAAINSRGQIAGLSDVVGGVIKHSYLLTPDVPNGTTGSMIDLGALPGSNAGADNATGINDFGQVAGGSGFPQLYLWTPTTANGTTGSMINLGELPGEVAGFAFGINSFGQVVGECGGVGAPHAFLWTPHSPNGMSGQMIDLGALPGGGDFCRANGINSYGQVVGLSSASTGTRAFLWTPATQNGSEGLMIDLGDLPGGDDFSAAQGINSRGQVVGVRHTAAGNRAFLWSPDIPNGTTGTMIDLGDLPGVLNRNSAHDINAFGQVVGESSNGPFVWTPSAPNSNTGTMVDLNTVLTLESSAGWSIGSVSSINDHGQIVGLGAFDPDGPGPTPLVTRGGFF